MRKTVIYIFIYTMVISAISGCNSNVPETETAKHIVPVENTVQEISESSKGELTKLYNLSQISDTEELLHKYSVGFHIGSDPDSIYFDGNIGDLVSAYKDIDLNGDGIKDCIRRKAKNVGEGYVNIEYSISINSEKEGANPIVINDSFVCAIGISAGTIFEFNDINGDGYDEVLLSQYLLSTGGFCLIEVRLYYISQGHWEKYDFTEDLDDIVGAELTDDRVALLIDYADKWSNCYDVFMYKLIDDHVECVENSSSYAKTYWPVKYENSFSIADSLTDEGRAALSDLVTAIGSTGRLPDGTDISHFIEATGKTLDKGIRCGIIWITLVDLGQENEFAIRIWADINTEPNDFFTGEKIEKLFGYNVDEKKAFLLTDQPITAFYDNGYFVMRNSENGKFCVCKYNPADRSFNIIKESDDMWSDEITGAVGDNELIGNPPEFCINKNFELYKALNSGLDIINNGQL